MYPGLPRGDGDRGMDHQAGVFRCPLGKHGEVETRSCSKTIANVEESPLSLLVFKQWRRRAVEQPATANASRAATAVVMGAAPEASEEASVHGEISVATSAVRPW